MNTDRLLILSCSERKRHEPELLPAVERYNGPAYQVLRKYAREGDAPPTWVLSAEYGLIPSEEPIPAYDRRMTFDRARQLQPQVATALDCLALQGYNDVLVCAGRTYTAAFSGIEERFGSVTFTSGPLGGQLATLRDWLYGAPPAPPACEPGRDVVFKGQTLEHTATEVVRLAKRCAAVDPAGASRYAGWYVAAGDLRVAPKWLLGELTGVPVSDFRTADARRVLTALGVEVLRA